MDGYLVAGFHLTRTISKAPMAVQSGSVQGERMNPARVGRQQRYSCASVPRSAWLRFIYKDISLCKGRQVRRSVSRCFLDLFYRLSVDVVFCCIKGFAG